jgi:hypothetical protein
MDRKPPPFYRGHDLMHEIFTPDLLVKDSDAELIAAIHRNLPDDGRKPPLVLSVELVWERKLGAISSTGTLIVTTARQLTTSGGNGWTGFDGGDADILEAAIMSAVVEVEAGMIDRFIVRAADQGKATNDEVKALALN